MNGLIFDIQRFSIYDGPGIRTNVFFSGCNLRCLWCHNPESQQMRPRLMFYRSKCVGCGACKEFCSKALTEDCDGCGKCAEICCHGAKKLVGRMVSAEEVIDSVSRDAAFYRHSGGGVTLSGGEPLLQVDFAAEILSGCKARGYNTAIETAGNVPWEAFVKVLPFVDYVLYDIKAIDGDLHKRLTGVSNKLILENAARLKESGVSLLFRMPVLPTLNAVEVGKVKEFAGNVPLELLAYHNTCKDKYSALGKPFPTDRIEPPDKLFMQSLADRYGCIYAPTGI